MLGSPIVYLKRILMFQLSGFYYKISASQTLKGPKIRHRQKYLTAVYLTGILIPHPNVYVGFRVQCRNLIQKPWP